MITLLCPSQHFVRFPYYIGLPVLMGGEKEAMWGKNVKLIAQKALSFKTTHFSNRMYYFAMT